MAAKKSKLQEQFLEDVAKEGDSRSNAGSNIFRGVAIFVIGYTVPCADSLKRMMMLHGGIYHHYQTNSTTHIIASNLPNCKMKLLRKLKVVKPSWIMDSVQKGSLLDYRKYLLYTSKAQTRLDFNQKEVESGNLLQETKTSSENSEPVYLMQPDMLTTDVAEGRQSSHATTQNAADPNFLSEFYSHSRLHHISTMGALFKQYVAQLREDSDGRFPGQERLRECGTRTTNSHNFGGGRVIMHIDMDCFFVSVGLRDRPHLRGLPVAVTHAKGNIASTHQRKGVDRAFELNYYNQKAGLKMVTDVDETDSMSEIASCSYEARKCGLKNGMFLGTALKLCPNLRTIPYDFEGYKQVSHCLYNTVAAFTLDIEAVSCDEMFVDCTSVLQNTRASLMQFASFLRQEIEEKTGCTASAGFGANRLQARLATKKAKPNGQFYLEPSSVPYFMLDITVEDLPGVGRTLARRLHAMGAHTCSDLKRFSQTELQREFGAKTGNALYRHCRGEDDRALSFCHQRKSVSAEVNYGIRFTNQEEAAAFLKQLAGEVSFRLRNIKLKGRCITLRLMVRAKEAPVETAKFLGHGVCDQVTRSCTLATAVSDQDTIAREVLSILRQLSVKPSDLRGIGIQMTRLESENVSRKLLDRFLMRSTGETQQVSSSNAPQEESNIQKMSRTSNEDRSLSKRDIIHEAGPSSASQEESNIQKMPRTSNEDRSLSKRGTIDEAGPSSAPQEESNIQKMPRTSNEDRSLSKRGTIDEAGPSSAPQEESNIQKMPRTSNEDRSLSKRGTIDEAGPSSAPQEESNIQKMPRTSNEDRSLSKRGTIDEAGPSSAPQEESNIQKMPRTSNEDRSLSKRGTIDEAGPSSAPQEESNIQKMPRTSNEDRSLSKRGTIDEAGPSSAPQEESNIQKMPRTSNEDRSLSKRGTIHDAGPSNAPQQEVSRSENGCAGRSLSQFMPHEVCDLDEEVLAALPEDIRLEVLQAYQPRSSSQVRRDEVVTRVKSPANEQDISLYSTMTVNQVRALVKEWVSCEDVPQPCDVSMLADYLEKQIANQNLDDINLVAKCLYRHVYKKSSSVWQEVYHNIIEKVQDMMLVVYGAKLKLQDTFT
ncbi:DNA repair protein REV1 isoform X2 [Cryptotermes secundus]|nr:DNA repair protein REV1 isoform X2 [Cryptotermes secundus]XP_023724500.1 DNA repair protein REV1 isoform X2 [Cryptotermes secundus]XP_023724501.1 DNA repair protein REV1 isoform X2 [Cryptotermes secundus]